MTGFWTVVAAVFGLIFGSFATALAHRHASGGSLLTPSACPTCAAPIRWFHNVPVLGWLVLRGRCAACNQPISPRYPLAEAATAALFAGTVAVVPGIRVTSGVALLLVVAAFLWFALISVTLTLIDLATHRLPWRIVGPSYLVGFALLAAASLVGADGWALARAGVGAGALYGLYALLRLVRPGGMGGGDVTVAGLVGLHLGWLGWGPLVVGALAAFLLGGVFGLGLIASGKAQGRTAIPFGPWLLAGAWTGALAGAPITAWYVGLLGVR